MSVCVSVMEAPESLADMLKSRYMAHPLEAGTIAFVTFQKKKNRTFKFNDI